MKHQDLRTTDEKICDMLADEASFEEIGKRLQMNAQHVEVRFKVICAKMGRQAR
jgi:tetrahydromethanopterin S-methyltransferase subunit G